MFILYFYINESFTYHNVIDSQIGSPDISLLIYIAIIINIIIIIISSLITITCFYYIQHCIVNNTYETNIIAKIIFSLCHLSLSLN